MASASEHHNDLHIPHLPKDVTLLDAAQAYAKAGWFVLPMRRGDVKNPGSVLGKGWDKQSSRDPETIRHWFTEFPDVAGIALHVGRSGAVVIDVDHPELMPDWLREALENSGAPCQSTRRDGKGMHYIFLQPPGMKIGNSNALAKYGCDVRGTNGVIVVFPTPHPDEAKNGQYRWA